MSSSGDSNSSIEGNQTPDDAEVCCYYVLKLIIKKLMLKRLCIVLQLTKLQLLKFICKDTLYLIFLIGFYIC